MIVSKSKLKTKMLEIFRQIEKGGEELIVTHHDKPVLRIIPINDGETVETVFAGSQDQVTFNAPIDEPTSDEWGNV